MTLKPCGGGGDTEGAGAFRAMGATGDTELWQLRKVRELRLVLQFRSLLVSRIDVLMMSTFQCQPMAVY